MGHEVTVAGDGEEAWEIVRRGDVPLPISDWMMPRLDGPGLCRRIRDAGGELYTYIILLTSRESREDKLERLRAGADDFLTKPPDPDELAVRQEVAGRIINVHEVLARKNLRLAEPATIDELTQLKNRRRFNEDLEHLQGVSASLRTFVREHDMVARFGGEGFVVLLPSTDAETAFFVAERLRAAIAARTWPFGTVTVSFGVATAHPADTESVASLVEQADQALDSCQANRTQSRRPRSRGGRPRARAPLDRALRGLDDLVHSLTRASQEAIPSRSIRPNLRDSGRRPCRARSARALALPSAALLSPSPPGPRS